MHQPRSRIGSLVAVFAAALLLLPALAQAQDAGRPLRGVALVIGQSEYEHLSPLPNPANDADAIETLLSDLGFDSVRRSDRKASNLSRDLERFAEDAEGADVAVLYYSGHGIEAGGENWLVPVDADLSALDDAGDKLVPVSALVDKLKATVPVVIVMLDACRDNPFPPGAELRLSPDAEPVAVGNTGLGLSRSAVSLKATNEAATPAADENVGTVIAFAAEPGKVALDGEAGTNSPYAAAVLRHFDAMAGEEFGMVMRMVAEEVYLKTGGRQRPWINESLRRLLYFGEKPDEMTGDEGEILRERRGLLITISALPDPERRTIESVAADTGVPMDALYGMLKALGADVPDDPGQLETLLRGQTEKVKAMIAERDTLKSTDPEIMRLSNLADQALAEGALNTAISLRQQAKARAQEVEATVEDAEEQLRQRRLELAEVYAKSAEAYALAFKHREAGADYEEASRQVERWDDAQAFWYMRSASTAYLEAGKLRGGLLDFEHASETGKRAAEMVERLSANNPDNAQYWQDISAQTLNNWANATNALYSSSKRREALAQSIDAYERALKILNRDRVEQDWVVVQHNLAGALSLLGESEDSDTRLEEAVKAYEAALTVWTRDADPLKWALATANLANTQTKLGERRNDEEMLRKAIASFESALEVQTQDNAPLDWAWTQGELGDAYGQLARLTHDEADIRKSTAARQEALKVYTLDRAPRSWGQMMHNMAVDEQEAAPPEKRKEALQKSMAIYGQVLAALTPQEQPVEYALSAGNLGSVKVELGKAEKDEALIESGIETLRETIALYEQLERPIDVAFNMQDIGMGYVELGKIRSSTVEPELAIETYQQVIDIYTRNGEASRVDGVRRSLAFAQVELGYQRSRAGDYAGAVEAYRAALDNRDREKDLENWLFAANQVAIALHNVGSREEGVDNLRKAADSYRLALSATPADKTEDLAETQGNLLGVLRTISERTQSAQDYVALADAYGASVSLKDRTRDRNSRDIDAANRAWALGLAGEYGNDLKTLREAAAAYRGLPKTPDIPAADRVFYLLQFQRTLFLAANAGAGDEARREAIALVDENWPLIEKEGSAEQKVNALIDHANLIYALSYSDPASYAPKQVEDAFSRAVAAARETGDLALLRSAQKALAGYQFANVEDPAFPAESLRSGLVTLRDLLDATPKQSEPAAWAEAANWYGYALSLQGKRESNPSSFEEALPYVRESLALFESAQDKTSAAHVRDSLCTALVGLGRLTKKRDLVAEGVENCDLAVTYMRDQKMVDVLAIAEENQAEARKALAELGSAQ
ncbi:MAG: caspase family protein [Rhizobiaceae bacterium]|nr:caspase family protein [Rhizobiaceae bacterium]